MATSKWGGGETEPNTSESTQSGSCGRKGMERRTHEVSVGIQNYTTSQYRCDSSMYHVRQKTKLPELRSDKNILDENFRDRDWNHKLTAKAYADSRRGAMLSPVLPGEQVLLKNTNTSGKLSTNFQHTPFTVEKKEGQELTVRSPDGIEYRRNSSFVKLYTTTEGTTSTVNQRSFVPDCAETGGLQANTPRKSPSMSTPMKTPNLGSPHRTRSKRLVKVPVKYQDYVVK